MNTKIDKDNGKSVVTANGWYCKFQNFSINVFWNNVDCLVSAPTCGLGESRLWDKQEAHNISGKKMKIC